MNNVSQVNMEYMEIIILKTDFRQRDQTQKFKLY